MTSGFGPYGFPLDELAKIRQGEQIDFHDGFEPHFSEKYGWHYDLKLLERRGRGFEELARRHMDLFGNILD